ncbi:MULTISPECIES: DNA topoisomerase family protein [Pasteurellaceae]|uniref:Topoisomerase DNA-binding C4 zinc finger domain-containing protein n=1 Tax=Pasteurella atlantica TaxID=2827233 RepID=A0AAW8CPZ9_9PAST|nr:topoisomerase DNA-binding C4 zinc finger domain-containing protein [Pasteurella atlantica]MBR0574121.1 topoisomerase DNA-binding C4 zinc finger domain-containing protein [Pasteurella atlantica]MDP8040024.1 topoisomerase DNA-binding C4 zinc finger domain-containing protein [Pasteurella atlantica]MDP8042167.1 topoisomerase DNA-binding C4 zinc finger domain-containing protein [Pasteurella atlantica]MDP8044332.1 topoisomerase DNA-binding C4 zinc finger domain-containing protein [Pasteurella atla
MSLFEPKKQTELCPQCNAPLHIKKGKQGLFLGCSTYPNCDYLKPLHQSNHIIKTLEELCPECNHPLQLKQGYYGIFIGCSHYPTCHFTVHEEPQEIEFDCPECKKEKLVARQGRSGKTFYGCSGFPQCKFTLPSKPILKQCPQCGGELVIEKKQRGHIMYLCAKTNCQYLFNKED